MDQIKFSQAVEGYTLHAQARHLSWHTIADYHNTFRKLGAFLAADPPIPDITTVQLREFFSACTVSNKTLINYRTGLSALWTWALKEKLVTANIVHDVQSPKAEDRAVEPFTEADVRAMLGALDKSKIYRRPGQRPTNHSLATATRNRAIILLLLDTGVRASELCELTIVHCDIKNRTIKVFGKGAKERILPFSPSTGQAIWRYLATRKDARMNETLIATPDGRPLGRDDLRRLIFNIGERAGVHGAHPHRFRHTFAINFLRNGGNAYALQMALGHASMDMVRKYLALAQTDIAAAHLIASPVANWRL
jgi:site-specific recombinase XerD